MALDRKTEQAKLGPDLSWSHGQSNWVYIGRLSGRALESVRALAAKHPYRQIGNFYMLDLRRSAQDIQIWNLVEVPKSWSYWFFVNAYWPKFEPVRDAARESNFLREI
jgi:hypothetical protein